MMLLLVANVYDVYDMLLNTMTCQLSPPLARKSLSSKQGKAEKQIL